MRCYAIGKRGTKALNALGVCRHRAKRKGLKPEVEKHFKNVDGGDKERTIVPKCGNLSQEQRTTYKIPKGRSGLAPRGQDSVMLCVETQSSEVRHPEG